MKKFNLIRALIFIVSIFSLSSFFEAGRIIANEQTLSHLWTVVLSGIIFLLSLFIMGYWVYAEEKEKNNLKVNFKLFEWIYKAGAPK